MLCLFQPQFSPSQLVTTSSQGLCPGSLTVSRTYRGPSVLCTFTSRSSCPRTVPHLPFSLSLLMARQALPALAPPGLPAAFTHSGPSTCPITRCWAHRERRPSPWECGAELGKATLLWRTPACYACHHCRDGENRVPRRLPGSQGRPLPEAHRAGLRRESLLLEVLSSLLPPVRVIVD